MTSPSRLCLVAAWLSLGVLSGQPAELLLEFTFNDSGPWTHTTERSAWDWPLEFQTQEGEPANWHGTAGSGVSGQPTDLAFDNTASTAMGSSGEGGRAIGSPQQIDPLDSVTLSGWFRTEAETLGSFGRLVWFDHRQQIYAWPEASLTFVATGSRNVGSNAAWTETNTWLFFAVTLDGTASENNVHFYKGTLDQPVTPVSTGSVGAGPYNISGVKFCLGNNYADSAPTQPFDGWLDNFRVHGGSDSTGVLTLEELEALRAADIAGPPPAIRIRTRLGMVVESDPAPRLGFSWWSMLEHNYEIQASNDLLEWSDTGAPPFVGDGLLQQWTLSPPPTVPTFYRLLIIPQN